MPPKGNIQGYDPTVNVSLQPTRGGDITMDWNQANIAREASSYENVGRALSVIGENVQRYAHREKDIQAKADTVAFNQQRAMGYKMNVLGEISKRTDINNPEDYKKEFERLVEVEDKRLGQWYKENARWYDDTYPFVEAESREVATLALASGLEGLQRKETARTQEIGSFTYENSIKNESFEGLEQSMGIFRSLGYNDKQLEIYDYNWHNSVIKNRVALRVKDIGNILDDEQFAAAIDNLRIDLSDINREGNDSMMGFLARGDIDMFNSALDSLEARKLAKIEHQESSKKSKTATNLVHQIGLADSIEEASKRAEKAMLGINAIDEKYFTKEDKDSALMSVENTLSATKQRIKADAIKASREIDEANKESTNSLIKVASSSGMEYAEEFLSSTDLANIEKIKSNFVKSTPKQGDGEGIATYSSRIKNRQASQFDALNKLIMVDYDSSQDKGKYGARAIALSIQATVEDPNQRQMIFKNLSYATSNNKHGLKKDDFTAIKYDLVKLFDKNEFKSLNERQKQFVSLVEEKARSMGYDSTNISKFQGTQEYKDIVSVIAADRSLTNSESFKRIAPYSNLSKSDSTESIELNEQTMRVINAIYRKAQDGNL